MSASKSCGCGLSTCHCCAGLAVATPKLVENPPGAATLSVRIGRHGDFRASMLARLTTHQLADGSTPLRRLRTREPDDFTVSLLDAFAAADDVLTFYNQRLANEGYLPTATDFRSVEALARLVGYRPQPGVAASVFLAFEIDPNATRSVRIEKGFGVKTTPGQDELPQVFETSGELDARAAWNTLHLRKTRPQLVPEVMKRRQLWLAGTDTRLATGDVLLIETAPDTKPTPVRVVEVKPDPAGGRTQVRFAFWSPPLRDTQLAELAAKGEEFTGIYAPAVLAALDDVQALPRDEATEPLRALSRDAKDGADSTNKPEIRDLLNSIADRADGLAQEIDDEQRSSDTPLPDTFSAGLSFLDDGWLSNLSKAPSSARPSAASLNRSTEASFGAASAASLSVIAKALPAISDKLGRSLAGYTRAAPESQLKVHALRVRAGLFGRAFPKKMQALRDGDAVGALEEVGEWPIIYAGDKSGLSGRERPYVVSLDAVHDSIAPDSWSVIDMSGLVQPATGAVRVGPTTDLLITRVARVSSKSARADYGGSGDTTLLHLADEPWISYRARQGEQQGILRRSGQDLINLEFQLIRRTAVYAAPEPLSLAEQPISGDFCLGDNAELKVELDGYYDGIEPGRYVIVSGERTDIPSTTGIYASEVAMIAGVSQDVVRSDRDIARDGERNHTFITLADPLAYCYKRETVVIRGNVVKATHGETRRELLGGGDAAKPHQTLELKQNPLTFLAAATPRGAEAALELRVDDIRWHEAEDLIDAKPTDRRYVLRTGQDGKASARFGDGIEGARPPTGTQNIHAVYRTGIGRAGNARASQIDQLVSRPQGLRGVINPLAASGGADPESSDQVRRNAPLMTLALDRLVSVEDHASFARSFAGIAKAHARLISDGVRSLVHLTIAGEDDAPIDEGSDLMIALRRALVRYGDPFAPVQVSQRELKLLIVAARIAIEPDRLWDTVVAEVRRRLIARFGFDRREIASGLSASAVLAHIQATPGVDYVDLDTFGSIPTVDGAVDARTPLALGDIAKEIVRVTEAGVSGWESALSARAGEGGILAAELLLLAPEIPDTLILNQLKREDR